ncbi:porin family protein [Picosynechococcus sp. PCC 7003]|uniref:porin family protein n=1 Tax=Picosynechococcus sp. PCC 7003 TaxID=374981 RepID=UPI001E3767EC|nr:porin family protein [Picosynechococcus sp. PCC 7003]
MTNFFAVAVADEVNEASMFRGSTNTDIFDLENSAEILISDIVEQEKFDRQEEVVVENQVIEYSTSTFEFNFLEPMTIESANMLPQGTVKTGLGATIFRPNSQGNGLGLEVYNASVQYGIAENLQFNLDLSFLDDIDNVTNPNADIKFGVFSLAPSLKYRFIDEPSYNIAIVSSLEWIKVKSQNNTTENTLAGTVQIPMTYNLTDNSQWHLAAGFTVFPDTVNDDDFYGTFFNIGTGFNLKIGEKFGLLADVNYPIEVSGGNSVSNTEKIKENLVWNAGFSYLHSPNVSLDMYVTNRLGNTPATKLLTFPSDGDSVGVGANLKYTLGSNNNYRSSFSERFLPSMNDREKQLVFDGILLSSPNTLRKEMFLFDGAIGSGGNIQIGYGLSDNAQIELTAQQLADNNQPIGNSMKLGAATKFNFLNQAIGDPFSLAIRGAFQDASNSDDDGIGLFLAETIFSYSANDAITFMFNPKAGFFGDETLIGTGLGVNLQLSPGLQLIGEVTPMVSNDPIVWAAGARYLFPKSNFGLGVYGTNAAGKGNIGSLIHQSDDDVSVGFNLTWLLGGGRSY